MPGTRRQAERMQARRSPAIVASIAALLLVATGCGLADDRPASDYGTAAEALRALPAVASVDGPHLPTDEAHGADDTTATAFTVALDEEADAAALRSTGDDAFALVNDHRYPDGPPHVTISSGPFTGEVPVDTSTSCNCVPESENIDLSLLPRLLTLPDVSAGSLGEIGGTTQIELDDGTDVHAWAQEAADTAAETAEDSGVVQVEAAPADDGGPRYRLDLGAVAVSEAARTLHRAAADTGTEVVRAEITVEHPDSKHPDADVSDSVDSGDAASETTGTTADENDSDPAAEDAPVVTEGTLTVAEDADAVPAHRTLLEHFDDQTIGTFTVEADSGLSIDGPGDSGDLDDVADALAALADAEVATASADAVDDTLTAHAADADGLRAAARLVSSPDWPLESDADVTVKHTSGAGTGSVFRAADWPDHIELVAGLWEAGFTSVDVEEISHAADLRIRLDRSTGPDPRTADGRTALVDALRTGGWDGTAEIIFADDDRLAFTSTADGTAQEAANRLAGAERTPRGWEQEFIDAWDATATSG